MEDSPSSSRAEGSSSGQKRKLTRASTACSACRKLKMKCVGGTVDKPCNRCERTGKECFLQERQRKKPSAKKDAEIQSLKAKIKHMEEQQGQEQNGMLAANHPHLDQPGPSFPLPGPGDLNSEELDRISSKTPQSDWLQTIVGPSPYPPSTPSLPSLHQQPSHSSLNISVPSPVTSSTSSHTISKFEVSSFDRIWLEQNSNNLPFLKSGKLSIEDSINLFKLFMLNCFPHTVVLDIEWHTLTKVGKSSNGFLLACILYVASAYDKERQKLQRNLQEEMDALIGKIITSGEKSVEIIQGFLLLYWWTKPSDFSRDNAWLYSGIAIRMATNLNLGMATSFDSPNKSGNLMEELEEERETRNRQRTWLMCYLVDRSLSASVGKQWTIKGDDFVSRNSDLWCTLPSARPWDLAISALADLLKTTSRQVDLLNTAVGGHSSQNDEVDFDCDTMMRIMNDELVQYKRKWSEKGWLFSPTNDSISLSSMNLEQTDIHNYVFHHIIRQANLRFNYAVLVLNSFGLQYCATRNLNHQTAGCRTFCIAHAIQAASNIVLAARDGLSTSLCFAPHTQFTMITFAEISLIKLSSLKKDDPVVSQRLIDLVESGISFLETVSISSTSTPARCASLLRAVLRRKRANDKLNRHEKPAYRPGMEEHFLPQQSSRSSSPFPSHHHHHRPTGSSSIPVFSSENDLQQQQQQQSSSSSLQPNHHQNHLFTPSSNQYQKGVGGFPSPNTNGTDQNFGAQLYEPQSQAQNSQSPYSWSNLSPDAIIANLGILPSNSDEDQMGGVFGSDGSLGWDELTADQVLDDSFWLKLG